MIQIKNLCKSYGARPDAPHALDGVSIDIADGDVLGIIGMSGAGKSTLVRCINLLERPTSGQIIVDGRDVTSLSGAALRAYRRRVAMIFQNFGLLSQKTVLANVCFPYLAATGRVTAENRERALQLLDLVGMADRADSYPSQLSGGQQQRVAIARALATQPEMLLCDEPTSALDPLTTKSMLALLTDINKKLGVTIIIITHELSVVQAICSHVAVISEGRLAESGAVADVFGSPRSAVTKLLLGREE